MGKSGAAALGGSGRHPRPPLRAPLRIAPWGCAIAALLAFGPRPAAAADRLRVVCSTTDLAAIAAAVGGDAVEVESLARGPQDPHYLQAKPSYMRVLNKADLLVFNGLQLEIGWLPLLIEGARNPRVTAGSAGSLDASTAIQPLEVPTGPVDRSMGDVHPEGNPHFGLDPRNGLAIAGAVADRLAQLAPDREPALRAAHQAFAQSLEARIGVWEGRAARLRGLRVVSYHRQFEYLADWLGLDLVAYVEDRPGIPPSPRHIEDLVARMGRDGVRLVITSTFTDPVPAQRLAERAGGAVVVLPAAVGAVDGADDYLSLFDAILDRLEAATATGS